MILADGTGARAGALTLVPSVGRTYTNATQVAIGTMNTRLPQIAPFIALLGSR
ncbi:hypothetical protein ABTZ03_43410 [Kitasatospora sp. NPDC096077]|uniref:hypothetical protein n=1 Tax=Kitasatospora sp. NPDC096077 TaxID=3155544 RepID=UPI00333307E6